MTQPMRPFRRLSAAGLAGVVALSVTGLAPVSAQTAEPPAPTPITDLCANVPAEHQPFVDVSDTDTFAGNIRCLSYAGITHGQGEGTYAPLGTVNREQMASFLTRLVDTAAALQSPASDPGSIGWLPAYDGSNAFSDVADDGDHVANINRLAAAGITLGGPGDLPDSAFGPGLSVTREQMASFITRTLEHLTGDEQATGDDYFSDDDTSAHEDNINAVAAAGIAIGDGPGRFGPGRSLTRGQMSAFLTRSLANLERAGAITPISARPPLVLASSDGVSVRNVDGTTTEVSDVPAAAAYGVGDDLVVFQGVQALDDFHPPGTDGPVRVWDAGEVRELAAGPDSVSTALLTAGYVDGDPVALVAEYYGSGQTPEDAFEELVQIDLVDGTRTSVVRRPTWESGHVGAGLLPDGDVIGLVYDETFVSLIRWSPGAAEAVWGTAVGEQVRVELAYDGRIAVVETPHDGAPSVAVTAYDPATGEPGATTTVDLVGSDTTATCGEWYGPYELACTREGTSPLTVSLRNGSTTPLPGPDGAIPTVVRTP